MDLDIKDNNRTIENVTLAIRRMHNDGKKITLVGLRKETGMTTKDLSVYISDIIMIMDALGYEY